MIHHITGDLLDADLPAIAHGCNTQGVMGAGIAKLIKERWPNNYRMYRTACEKKFNANLGDVLLWKEHTTPIQTGNELDGRTFDPDDAFRIYNLMTQVEPGPHANVYAIAIAVRRMMNAADMVDVPIIGMPRIGAGIGGLKWTDVEDALQVATLGSRASLEIYTLPSEVGKFR